MSDESRRDERQKHQGGVAAQGHRAWLPRVTIVMVVVVALLSVASYLQIKDIERGLLSVVAGQQDGYVELVVGQINLKQNRDDQEIIDDILSVLDENSSQYWTFTRDGMMVYVKDVTETNKYKGLPSGSFFEDQGASDFYNGLSTDHVTHAYVTVDGADYIASGQAFAYRGGTYRLCLLTNESVVLDNNQLLGAKSRLGALLGIEAALLLFSAIWLALHRDRKSRALAKSQAEVATLTQRVDELDAREHRRRAFDTDARAWDAEALAEFEESLARRGRSGWLATVTCADVSAADALLARMAVLFGEEVARFHGGSGDAGAGTDAGMDAGAARVVRALFLNASEQQAHEQLDEALGAHAGEARVNWEHVGSPENRGEDEQEEA